SIGLNVYYHTVVGDNPQRVRDAVDIAKKRADIIITTGGLGPTCDDLTKVVLAEAFGKKMVFHQESADRITEYFTKRNLLHMMTDNNLQQAMLPEDCTLLVNDWGTAPGCAFFAEDTHVIMLPGPPSECKPMFYHRAVPYLAQLSEGIILSTTLKFFGIGESKLEDSLRERMNTMQNPTLAPYAKTGECELRVTAKAATREEAEALLAPEVEKLQEQFGNLIYGVDVTCFEEAVLKLLVEHGVTLATAESCTGGLIGKRITDLSGSSKGYLGGVIAYSNEVKEKVLGVDSAILEEFGAVSEQTAIAMAEGVRKLLGADIAIATTGVAGPDLDDRGNEVGTVYIAIATAEGTHVRHKDLGNHRDRVRILAGHHGFDLVRRYLNKIPYDN
ncbi:MAG: competence/damage-inducible protein A, partial [Eubacteriales bacterium]